MYPEHLKIDSLQSLYVKNRLKSIFLILMILICLIKKTTLRFTELKNINILHNHITPAHLFVANFIPTLLKTFFSALRCLGDIFH